MSIRTLGIAAIAGLSITATPAFATGGWDWDEDFMPDHWRTATLRWAQDINPDHPSFDQLQNVYNPPPDEPWCHAPPAPVLEDCDFHDELLEAWVRDYLDIPTWQSLPKQMIPYPYECMSPCSA